MDTIDADKEVITRYVKEFLRHGDPAELASYLIAEDRYDQEQALALTKHVVLSIETRQKA